MLAAASTVSATHESQEPVIGPGTTSSVWFTWTAASEGPISVTTAGSSFDTILAVYNDAAGTLAGLAVVAINDDCSGLLVTSCVSFVATAGSTYAIQVDGYGGASGTALVVLTKLVAANDAFSRYERSEECATIFNG